MSGPVTYAKSGGPPDEWRGLRVFDRDSGAEIEDVEEVNAAEGWLIRYKRNDAGDFYLDPAKPDEAARERIEGNFEIRLP